MDWQLLITWIAIGSAGGFILWRGGRLLLSKRGNCSGGCGCVKRADEAPANSLISPEQLKLRIRH